MSIMEPRLSLPRKDVGKWGAITNQFLRVSHNEDGTLKASVFTDLNLLNVFGTGLLFDDTVLKVSAVLQKYHAIDPSANVQTLLGAADFAAFNTSLGLGTGDSPTLDDLTLSTPVNIYALSHDSFSDFVANEHIDWTNASDAFKTSGIGGFGDTVQITGGASPTIPASGAGIELRYDSDNTYLGGTGLFSIESYDRTGSAWKDLLIGARATRIRSGTTTAIDINTNGEVSIPVKLDVGTMTLDNGSITDSGGTITLTGDFVIDVGTPTLTIDESGGGHPRLTSSSGQIEFNSSHLISIGTIGADVIVGSTSITTTSFIIGGNTLDTNEWAVLDGVTANMVLDWTTASVGTIDATNIEDKFLRNDGDDISTGGLTLGSDLVMGGNIVQNADVYVKNYLYHYGDSDTGILFGGDYFYFVAGGLELLRIKEATFGADEVIINENGVDINFRVEGVGQANALFVQGSDGMVGIRNATPAYELDVTGTINATGKLGVGTVPIAESQAIAQAPDAQSAIYVALYGLAYSDSTVSANAGVQGSALGGGGTDNIGVYARAENATNNYGFYDSFGNYSDAGGWNDVSDPTRKSDIRSLKAGDRTKMLDALNIIEVKAYRFRDEVKEWKDAPERYGWLADELPDFLSSKDKKGVCAARMAAFNTVCIQELKKRIEALEKAA